MILKCDVLINNEAVTVVRFDGNDVQLPSIHRDAHEVLVRFDDGKYYVVPDDYKEPIVDEVKKKNLKKKTTAIEEDIHIGDAE